MYRFCSDFLYQCMTLLKFDLTRCGTSNKKLRSLNMSRIIRVWQTRKRLMDKRATHDNKNNAHKYKYDGAKLAWFNHAQRQKIKQMND